MGDRGICNYCRGKGYRWNGGPPERMCWPCRGTGLAPPYNKYTNWRYDRK